MNHMYMFRIFPTDEQKVLVDKAIDAQRKRFVQVARERNAKSKEFMESELDELYRDIDRFTCREGDRIKVLKDAIVLPELGEVKSQMPRAVSGNILCATVVRPASDKMHYIIYIFCANVDEKNWDSRPSTPL